jgi:hypothetical protein
MKHTQTVTQTVVFEQENKQIVQQGNHFFARVSEDGETLESQDFNTLDKAKLHLGIMPTIAENNKLIAKFMGYSQPHPKYLNATYWYKEGEQPLVMLLFDEDWNRLIEVVEKIESLGFETSLDKNGFFIRTGGSNTQKGLFPKNKREGVYNACVEFIKWYNENK